MAVVIGSSTLVTVTEVLDPGLPSESYEYVTDGFQNVSWATQVDVNRLWQIGTWHPYKSMVTKTLTCNITSYANVLYPVDLEVSDDCAISTASKIVDIDSSACANATNFSSGGEGMYITSYSYSKGDPASFATESWSLQLWVDADPNDELDPHFIAVPTPSGVVQGITEGNYSGNLDNPVKMGVTPHTGSTPPGYSITGSQGQVSAAFPGIGEVNDITYCIINRIGAGVLGDAVADQGKTGNSQANVQHTPLYTKIV